MLDTLKPKERIVLAIDTSSPEEAEMLVTIAYENGAKFIKFGLEYATATSWKRCAELAAKYSLEWIADAKLDDIPNTTAKAIKNILNTTYPPFGITVHSKAGIQSLRLAQETAGNTIIFGVTELTAIPEIETKNRYGIERGKLVESLVSEIILSGSKGIVASGIELPIIKLKNLVSLVPGIRSKGFDSNDQQNIVTPSEALANGADLIVVGRQVILSDDPRSTYKGIVNEVESQF